jgi:gamma-glutamyl hercynylcysteine S-oxide synthase
MISLSRRAPVNPESLSSRNTAVDVGVAARSFDREAIARELISMRTMLRAFVSNLTDTQCAPPLVATINPPLWEAAHVAWFAEWFCVRDAFYAGNEQTQAKRASLWAESDAFLDSNTIAHDARWHLPQVTRESTLDYLDRNLAATLAALERAENNDETLYRFRLAMFHEAMHLEALAWMAQTLAWEGPEWVSLNEESDTQEILISNAINRPFHRGYNTFSYGFRFDNENGLTAHLNKAIGVEVRLVSNAEFLRFVESGAYSSATQKTHPSYWRKRANHEWEQRRFDRWILLAEDEAVVHVSAHEAEAYAAWIGARLPTEDELHAHFEHDENAWHGQVWEWTSTPFAPYVPLEQFEPGLYREYSKPWFDGKHRVLRGGSFATLPIMHHPHYRNYFTPERSDVFAGFRVVATV